MAKFNKKIYQENIAKTNFKQYNKDIILYRKKKPNDLD